MLAAPNRAYKIESKISDSLQLRPSRVMLRLTVMKFNTLFEGSPATARPMPKFTKRMMKWRRIVVVSLSLSLLRLCVVRQHEFFNSRPKRKLCFRMTAFHRCLYFVTLLNCESMCASVASLHLPTAIFSRLFISLHFYRPLYLLLTFFFHSIRNSLHRLLYILIWQFRRP